MGLPLINSDGSPFGLIVLFSQKPIQDEKLSLSILNIFRSRIANELERLDNEMLKNELIETTSRQNARLKNFSFITSHNIRSAVSNIQGLTDLILAEETYNRRLFTLLKQASLNLDQSVKNANDLLQLEEKPSELEITDFEIPEIIQRVLDQLSEPIHKHGIDIDIEVPDLAPMRCNQAYVESILYNLISNACKYGINESSKTIKISVETQNSDYFIKVQDFGDGIDLKQHADRIFELGSRLHHSEDGQGFGLFMTKHQVEVLGGSIVIKSAPNQGAAFSVKVPNSVAN
jgi:signal transduction histidine kinase